MLPKNFIDNLYDVVNTFKNSIILVTGATGMIGQNVVKLLLHMNKILNSNIHVLAHCRNQEKANLIYWQEKNNGNLSFIFSDIKQLDYSGDIDFIIHTASITGGSKQHVDYPINTIDVALVGTKRVLELTKDKNASAIFLSSLEVYGFVGDRKNPLKETDFGFIDCTNPRSSYSESKRMCECLFSAYAKQYNLNAYIARLTATFGYGVSASDNRVFSQFAKSIISKNNIVLKSTGGTVRNYCDSLDAASAFLYILSKGRPGKAYNVANMATEISIRDLAQRFIDLYPESGTKMVFDLSSDATNFGYNAEMKNVLDSSELMSLGWKPVFGIDDMIGHLVSSMKSIM